MLMNVRTRFAPSPTGFMHIGNVRTGLFAWLFARKYGGQFVLRIEDTDKVREVEGAIGHIMEALTWLGIDWDEGPNNGGPYEPYVQSSRLELYQKYAHQLLNAGFAYPDPYTTEHVDAFRKEAEAQKKPFLFREHRPDDVDEATSARSANNVAKKWDGTTPLRFRVPIIKRYEWHDLVYGDLSAGEEALDDFILMKSDGYPTYNFAHVVDDIEMKITHVMRGQEFISSTPKFLSLYDALELPPPHFASLPAILGEGGNKKLGKRDGAKDFLEYRAGGYLPQALMNFLALIGWNDGTENEIFSKDDLIKAFDIERVQRSGGQFDEEKLLFINKQWMRQLSDEEYIKELYRNTEISPENADVSHLDTQKLSMAIPLLKERAETIEEAKSMLSGELSCLFVSVLSGDEIALTSELLLKNEPENASGLTKIALEHLTTLISSLPATIAEERAENNDTNSAASPDEVKALLMPYADQNPKEMGGRGAILWPLRYTLSGLEKSPDPFTIISILGADESVARITKALEIL
jgi:glutamyl-tRNA synthetase